MPLLPSPRCGRGAVSVAALRLVPRVLVVVALVMSGCGGSKKPDRGTVPVSGTITYQGKPLPDASIYFFSDKFSAYGKTDAEGKYRIAQGAIPGENKVFVSKITGDAKAIPNQIADDPGQVAAANAATMNDPNRPRKVPRGELLPPEMSDPERTQLTFKVPAEGTETANFSF